MASDLVPLTLITGDEELLVSRAIADVVAAARAVDPQADVREYAPEALDAGVLLDLASPSLFGELRVAVLRLGSVSDDVRDGLCAFVADPHRDVTLVVVHPGGNTGKRIVDACKAAGAHVVPCAKIDKARDRIAWVTTEARRCGGRITDDAARLLCEAVGGDLRELAGACAQLIADSGGVVDEVAVGQYFSGRAEASGFVIADRAVEGRVAAALVELRQAFAVGLEPVLVTSALARQLRTVARVASAGRVPPDVIARELKLAPWMVDKARKQARGWTPDALARAHAAVAFADAEVKGGGTDPRFAVERAVVAVATAGEGG